MNKVIVKKSNIDRKGVFAARDFKKGDIVLKWSKDSIISKDRFTRLSEDEKNHTFLINKNRYLILKSPEKFVNHSCNANTYVKSMADIALRDIKKGEEITSDYSKDNYDEDWEMKCNCGEKNCKKIIRGNIKIK